MLGRSEQGQLDFLGLIFFFEVALNTLLLIELCPNSLNLWYSRLTITSCYF